jgi:hypothetical protein
MDEHAILGTARRVWALLADRIWLFVTAVYVGLLADRLGSGTGWLLSGFASPRVCCQLARRLWRDRRRGQLDPVRAHRAMLWYLQRGLSALCGEEAACSARIWVDRECARRDADGVALWTRPEVKDVALAAMAACQAEGAIEEQLAEA